MIDPDFAAAAASMAQAIKRTIHDKDARAAALGRLATILHIAQTGKANFEKPTPFTPEEMAKILKKRNARRNQKDQNT